MKFIKGMYVWLLSCIIIMSACSDEDIVKSYNIKEGVPVAVTLKYNIAASSLESRSAQSSEVEQTVQRLFVIAFRANGEISGKAYQDNEMVTSGSGSITISQMYSGERQQIFAVANPNSGVGTLDLEALNNVTTLEEFKDLTSSLRQENNIERMAFLMCGQLKNNDGATDIAINEEGKFVNVSSPIIRLERVDARITFNIGVDSEANGYQKMTFTPKYYMVGNIPQGTYLVPHEEDYDGGYASMEKGYYFDEEERENDSRPYFEFYMLENRIKPTNRITEQVKAQTYPEVSNLYALREKREEESIQTDETKPGQQYKHGKFIFAPEHSTYVIIRGTLAYQDPKENKFVHADVTYTVHLGSTGYEKETDEVPWYNNEDLVNNYETKRNTHYIYNVTITGVESMRVEVIEEKEERPGVEGDVIVAGGEVVDLDSHYGRTKFSLTRKAIKDGLSWAISTPFQSGLKVFERANYTTNEEETGDIQLNISELTPGQIEKLQTDGTLNDYRWVQFAINQECILTQTGEAVPSTAFAKYPGYQSYLNKNLSIDEKANAFGNPGSQSDGSIYKDKVVLYDVNQLLNHLFIEAYNPNSQLFLDPNTGQVSTSVDDDDSEVTITAYIDEFVYKYDPTKIGYKTPNETNDLDLSLWKDVVNGENRMLHICVQGAKYSPDGNTSWAESVITFSQRPIYTFYNPKSGVNTAWGTEFKIETESDNIPVACDALEYVTWNNTSTSDGRQNTLNILKQINGLKWTDVLYLNDKDYGHLKDPYKSVWFACLSRNRDLNGNNIVEEDEIRWFLAAVDQLTDIWIGEAAVPNAKLYPSTSYVGKSHVISSTRFDSQTPWIIWAEEGASRGGYGISGDNQGDSHSYRCIRNLGMSLSDVHNNVKVDDYVVSSDKDVTRKVQINAEEVTFTERIIDVNRLDENTLRSALYQGILPSGGVERDDNNRPYKKFAVIVKAKGGSYTNSSGLYPINGYIQWSDLYNNERNGYPCPDGYRAPNQRELMLMYTTYPTLFGQINNSQYSYYLCKTGFSFASNYGGRTGFYYVYEGYQRYGNLKLRDIGEGDGPSGKVRCVRDIVE